MRLAELGGSTYPARTDHKQNLRQNQIAQSQRLFEGGALLFNIAFCAIKRSLHRSSGRLKVIPSESRGCNAAPNAFGARPGFLSCSDTDWFCRWIPWTPKTFGAQDDVYALALQHVNGSTVLMFLCG